MEGNELKARSPLTKILVFIGVLLVAMFVGNFIGFLGSLFFVGFDMQYLMGMIADPISYQGSRSILFFMQGVIALFTFLLAPWIFVKYFEPDFLFKILNPHRISPFYFLVLGLLVIVLIPFSSAIVELFDPAFWPPIMKDLGIKIQKFDNQYDQMASFFIDFDSAWDFLFACVVMAVIPAFGEEFVFRGIFQKYSISITKNVFWGILFSSLIFAAFHLQVSGLLPRLFLGMIFGYLYYWSGNILLPIFGHFINNFFTLTLAGMYKIGLTEIDLSSEIHIPWFAGLISFCLSALLFYWIRKSFKSQTNKAHEELAGGI
jgi:CAAX protease family protein